MEASAEWARPNRHLLSISFHPLSSQWDQGTAWEEILIQVCNYLKTVRGYPSPSCHFRLFKQKLKLNKRINICPFSEVEGGNEGKKPKATLVFWNNLERAGPKDNRKETLLASRAPARSIPCVLRGYIESRCSRNQTIPPPQSVK